MILFDGTENYELGNLSIHERVNHPPKITLGLAKNTNTYERLGVVGEPQVIRYGQRYETQGLHDLIMQLDIKAVGTFIIHAMDPLSRQRLDSLKAYAVKYHRAELYLHVNLTGDCVPSEPGMAPFDLKVLAQPGNWTMSHFMRDQFK